MGSKHRANFEQTAGTLYWHWFRPTLHSSGVLDERKIYKIV
jgi:hypothetical protein